MKVEVVNGFTIDQIGGNEAGVVITDRPLPSRLMQNIAAQAGFSETAFVEPWGDIYACRFFTPSCEVDLCGHATIAAFFLLAEKRYIRNDRLRRTVGLQTAAGRLRVLVVFSEEGCVDKIMMEQARPIFLGEIDRDALGELCETLGIDEASVGLHSSRDALPEIISTGLPDVILPVIDRERLAAIDPDFDRLAALSKKIGVVGVHAFTLQTHRPSSTVSSRNFGPAVGIDEESATGTSNGALGIYLFKKGLLSGGHMVSEQGFGMGKPSLIYVDVIADQVWVGGHAVKTGEIMVNL
jgi:PhzF family phenazine biosynthesis protein